MPTQVQLVPTSNLRKEIGVLEARETPRLPRISVVIPSFNHAEFLEATLKSVLDQDYPIVEVIVMDGGSEDGTRAILDRYREDLAYVVSEPDEGQTAALIKGFERATGDILAWLCSDDIYEPKALWEVARHFATHPEDQCIYGDATWIDRSGTFLKYKREHPFNRYVWLHDYNYIPQPSTFWRRELYERVGGLDPNFQLAMDADLWARFSDVTELRHVPRLWSRMRYYEGQKNLRYRRESDAEDRVIRQRYGIKTAGPRWTIEHYLAKGIRTAIRIRHHCFW